MWPEELILRCPLGPLFLGNPHLIHFFAYSKGHTGDSRVKLAASRELLLKLTCVKWASVLSLHAERVTPGPPHHFLRLCNCETVSTYARLFLQTTEVSCSKGLYLLRRLGIWTRLNLPLEKQSLPRLIQLTYFLITCPFLPQIYFCPMSYWFTLRWFYYCCCWFVYLILFVCYVFRHIYLNEHRFGGLWSHFLPGGRRKGCRQTHHSLLFLASNRAPPPLALVNKPQITPVQYNFFFLMSPFSELLQQHLEVQSEG